MQPLFLGGHPAIDFLNTSFAPDGVVAETIGDGAAYVRWLSGAGLLEQAVAGKMTRRFGTKALDVAAAEARRVREWTREWIARWRARPAGDFGPEIAMLNKLLAREASIRQVVAGGDGFRLVAIPTVESANALIALVAAQFAALITAEDPALIKDCAGAGCTLTFLDHTKAHRRLFCSTSACGNRARVAAFRSRQRS